VWIRGDFRPGLLGGGVDRVKPLVGGDPFTVDEVGEFIHFGFCFQLEASRVSAAAMAGEALDDIVFQASLAATISRR
jgi:hypothetical protein